MTLVSSLSLACASDTAGTWTQLRYQCNKRHPNAASAWKSLGSLRWDAPNAKNPKISNAEAAFRCLLLHLSTLTFW